MGKASQDDMPQKISQYQSWKYKHKVTLESGIVIPVGIMVLVGIFVKIKKYTGWNKGTGGNYRQRKV